MDMNPNKEAIALLQRAQELMNDGGRHWIKGNYKRFVEGDDPAEALEQAYCSVGAIMEAAGTPNGARYSLNMPATKALLALRAVVQATVVKERPEASDRWDAHDYVVAFNDKPERTWPEVRSAFRRAIKQLKAA